MQHTALAVVDARSRANHRAGQHHLTVIFTENTLGDKAGLNSVKHNCLFNQLNPKLMHVIECINPK